MTESPSPERTRHAFKNHLAIVIGFSDLLLADLADDDPRRKDVLEIRRAGQAALDLLASLWPPPAE